MRCALVVGQGVVAELGQVAVGGGSECGGGGDGDGDDNDESDDE